MRPLARGTSVRPSITESSPLDEQMCKAKDHLRVCQKRAEKNGNMILSIYISELLSIIMSRAPSAKIDRSVVRKDIRHIINEIEDLVDATGNLERELQSTEETTIIDDDPNAGPYENWVIRPPRLEINRTLQPLPASPFMPNG